ncbi:MAG: hypothetical protein L6R40_002119 [Gallowayella cf. fulva]|nr:MAG: hypothetical protein L6R40_002119 [Xanthomendoza cf. fulva]
MKVSIYAFLLGLSIYQGFIWTRGLDTGAGLHDSRDVFITFMVGSGACLLYYFMTFRLKSVQDDTMYDGEEKIGVSDAVHLNTLTGSAQVPFGTDHTQNVPQTLHQELESQDLVAALEVAAQAHLKCAEADQKVASLYSVANQVGSNRNNETTQAGDVIPG